MRLHIICIFIFFTIFSLHINAQSFVGVSTGFSVDLNNKRPFYIVPVILHAEPFQYSSFFIEAEYGEGFNRISHADAYTLNPQMPEHLVLTEAVRPITFSIGMGGSIRLYHDKRNNSLKLNLSSGIGIQNYHVNYRNYDKANYEVLDPDVDKRAGWAIITIAIVYNFHNPAQDMFLMLRFPAPPLELGLSHYPSSFKAAAPLQFAFGYKFFQKKTKR